MGFSPLGLIVSVAVLAPNLLMLAFPPRGTAPAVAIPTALTWLERAGQALCLVVPAMTAPGAVTWPWLAIVAAAIAAYYGLWLRYLTRGRSWALLYAPLLRLPVPMAVFPVVAFLGTAAWLGNGWIAAAALLLAAGHIPSAAFTANALRMPVSVG